MLSKEIKKCKFKWKKNGSATVEALLILPVVLTLILSIGWLADIIGIHSEIGGALNRVGNGMVTYSYALDRLAKDKLSESELGSTALNVALTEASLRKEISKTRAAGRIQNLTTLFSGEKEEGELRLHATYKVTPPVKIPYFQGFYLKNSFYSRTYKGCLEEPDDSELVYITRTGTVYHTITDCRALKVTVNAVAGSRVDKERNISGARYYPCEKCAKDSKAESVYITPYGNRYHNDRDCYEINSIWFEVPLSRVKGRRKCYFCP